MGKHMTSCTIEALTTEATGAKTIHDALERAVARWRSSLPPKKKEGKKEKEKQIVAFGLGSANTGAVPLCNLQKYSRIRRGILMERMWANNKKKSD